MDLFMDVGLGGNLDINVGLSGALDMDVGLGSGVEVGIGHRWVIGGTIDSSIDCGGGGSGVGNWGGGGVGSGGGGGIAVSGVASSVGETSSVAVSSVDGDLSLGHGGTQSDNSDKSLHCD